MIYPVQPHQGTGGPTACLIRLQTGGSKTRVIANKIIPCPQFPIRKKEMATTPNRMANNQLKVSTM